MAKDRDERSSFAFTLGREMLDLDLKGSHVLVTGANGGIGTPTVDLLQSESTHPGSLGGSPPTLTCTRNIPPQN
jgi:hypothetical protein